MKSTLTRPFTVVWDALVRYHRDHMGDDPDVMRLRQQRRESEAALQRIDQFEATGNFLRDRYTGQWEGNRDA